MRPEAGPPRVEITLVGAEDPQALGERLDRQVRAFLDPHPGIVAPRASREARPVNVRFEVVADDEAVPVDRWYQVITERDPIGLVTVEKILVQLEAAIAPGAAAADLHAVACARIVELIDPTFLCHEVLR